MHTALLIAAALVLAFYARPRDKQSYHIAIMAIFGIAYFCIWRFARFYLDVFGYDTTAKNTAFGILMLATVVIALLPWIRHTSRKPAIALAVLFGLCVVPTFALEKNIKNVLAQWGGYFDNAVVVFQPDEDIADGKSFHSEAGGFDMRIPGNWRAQTHPSGMQYFQWVLDGKTLAELRPRCFHNTELSIPEIVINILNWDRSQEWQAKKQCFHGTNNGVTCFIRSNSRGNKQEKEKWRWLVMDKYQRQNIELDAVFYTDRAQARRDAEAMINSLVVTPLADPLPLCASSVEWF